VVLTAVTGQVFASRQETEVSSRQREVARSLCDHLDSYLNGHAHAIEALALTMSGAENHRGRRAAALKEHLAIYPILAPVAVFTRGGWWMERPPPVLADHGSPTARLPLFDSARASRSSVISDVAMSSFGAEPTSLGVTISAPVVASDGAFSGVVATTL